MLMNHNNTEIYHHNPAHNHLDFTNIECHIFWINCESRVSKPSVRPSTWFKYGRSFSLLSVTLLSFPVLIFQCCYHKISQAVFLKVTEMCCFAVLPDWSKSKMTIESFSLWKLEDSSPGSSIFWWFARHFWHSSCAGIWHQCLSCCIYSFRSFYCLPTMHMFPNHYFPFLFPILISFPFFLLILLAPSSFSVLFVTQGLIMCF